MSIFEAFLQPFFCASCWFVPRWRFSRVSARLWLTAGQQSCHFCHALLPGSPSRIVVRARHCSLSGTEACRDGNFRLRGARRPRITPWAASPSRALRVLWTRAGRRSGGQDRGPGPFRNKIFVEAKLRSPHKVVRGSVKNPECTLLKRKSPPPASPGLRALRRPLKTAPRRLRKKQRRRTRLRRGIDVKESTGGRAPARPPCQPLSSAGWRPSPPRPAPRETPANPP